MTASFLALRFVLELCLLAAMALIGWTAFDSAVVGALAAVTLMVIVGLGWGMLLSPNRRIDLPLPIRVLIELALFAAAAAGMWASGLPVAGVVLLAGEVVVLAVLWARGLPPGSRLEIPTDPPDSPA